MPEATSHHPVRADARRGTLTHSGEAIRNHSPPVPPTRFCLCQDSADSPLLPPRTVCERNVHLKLCCSSVLACLTKRAKNTFCFPGVILVERVVLPEGVAVGTHGRGRREGRAAEWAFRSNVNRTLPASELTTKALPAPLRERAGLNLVFQICCLLHFTPFLSFSRSLLHFFLSAQ